jgi:hypothetical protein
VFLTAPPQQLKASNAREGSGSADLLEQKQLLADRHSGGHAQVTVEKAQRSSDQRRREGPLPVWAFRHRPTSTGSNSNQSEAVC